MTFTVFLADRAKADLETFSEKIHRQIIQDLKGLVTHPFPDGKRIKKLGGFEEELYRLRAVDYPVVF